MDKDKLTQRLIATFLTELEEHVRTLDQSLLALERATESETRQALLRTILRIAHSLKGAAHAVDATDIEQACHYLEEILSHERKVNTPIAPELVQLLLETGDALRASGRLMADRQEVSRGPLPALIPRLKASAGGSAALTPSLQTRGEDLPGQAADTPGAAARSLVPVAAEKLDALLVGGAELLIARRRIEHQVERSALLHEALHRFHAEWRRSAQSLLRTLRRSAADSGDAIDSVSSAIAKLSAVVADLEREADRNAASLRFDHHQLDLIGSRFDDDVRALRLTPFARATDGLDRIARDLARELGKEAALVVSGGEVEIDRALVEALRSPLIQLVRNAVSHGIESPEERRRSGKDIRGSISVTASLRASRVEITVEDDGRGVDLDAIREHARRRGIDVEAGKARHLIFASGFSTASVVSGASGRGVGLDIVKTAVESLRGTVHWDSREGGGARFILSVPLTLTTIRALLIEAAGNVLALESSAILRISLVAAPAIHIVEGRESVRIADAFTPLLDLGVALGFAEPHSRPGPTPVVVIQAQDRRIAFAVDAVLDEQDVLTTSLGPRFVHVRYVNGASILPDGRVALILNVSELADLASEGAARPALLAASGPEVLRRRILVVDDSATTRALEKSILEAAGYEVIIAPDGAEAWRLLERDGADLVVSDVEMPRMDGFALTERVRSSPRFRSLPIVLVTSRERDDDKARGLAAGADAYLVKSGFDQSHLLEVIAELL